MRLAKVYNAAALAALGLTLTGFLVFTSSLRAHAFVGGAAVTPTAYLYLPLVMRNYCSPASPPAPGNWLAYVNYQRALACLPQVTERSDWSYGDYLHARYMVKNDFIGHTEDSTNPWYTPQGSQAAGTSNVLLSSSSATTDEQAIDLWMRGPFHALGIIDPALSQVGFGSYREAVGVYQMGAALDVIRGLGSLPASVEFPVKWPHDGMTINLRSYGGFESPNPLTSCPGYTAPTGLPILLQLGGGGITPSVTGSSFVQDSTPLPHCRFDETNYTNANASDQATGRSILDARDAVVIIPQSPLVAGATYTVTVTANSQTYTWSFNVSLSATALDAHSLEADLVTR